MNPDKPQRRRIDMPALVFGMIFLAIAGAWLVDRDVVAHVPNAGWLIALLLIGGGALGITNAIRGDRGDSNRRRQRRRDRG